eukprot:PITA_31514
MLAPRIIAQTMHSAWCSNLVIVRKKNGTIRLCVDFQNLNLACKKYNYPLPNMETLLQRVTDFGMMSLLDGFSGYNQDGIKIDPERIEAIQKIPLPHNLKSLQSFLGKTNFLRRFIPNYAEMANPIQSLLKKDVKFVWQEDIKKAFQEIKCAIARAPVLVSLDYSKDFMIFSFASEDTIVGVLLQKNKDGHE